MILKLFLISYKYYISFGRWPCGDNSGNDVQAFLLFQLRWSRLLVLVLFERKLCVKKMVLAKLFRIIINVLVFLVTSVNSIRIETSGGLNPSFTRYPV